MYTATLMRYIQYDPIKANVTQLIQICNANLKFIDTTTILCNAHRGVVFR